MGQNGPFLSFKTSQFQNEAKCETFLVKMSFICMRIKTAKKIYITGFAHSLAFKQGLGATQKWPYASWPGFEFHFDFVQVKFVCW